MDFFSTRQFGTWYVRLRPNLAVDTGVLAQVKIDRIQTESASLATFGIDAARLLVTEDVRTLVEQFGYARALGRDCANAVRADLTVALAELGATTIVQADPREPRVSHRKANETGLFAQCRLTFQPP